MVVKLELCVMRHRGTLEATLMRVSRWIEGVSRLDRIRYVDLRQIEAGGSLDLVKRWQQRL